MNIGEVIRKSCRGCETQDKEDGTIWHAKILREVHRKKEYIRSWKSKDRKIFLWSGR